MIFLGKLLSKNDLNIFFYVNSVVESYNKDVINDIKTPGVLNDTEFTLNTFQTIAEQGQNLFDPHFVSYSIIDLTKDKEEPVRHTTNSKPMRSGIGHYWVPIKLDPRFFRIGRYLVKWEFKQYFDSELCVSMEEFDVTRPTAFAGEFCGSTYVSGDETYEGARMGGPYIDYNF